MLQLQGALSKNVVEKRRAWKVTCCEFFSHFIILVLLVYGHSLAEVTYHPEKHYSKIEVRLITPHPTIGIHRMYDAIYRL